MKIGKAIRQLRKERKLTQSDICRAIDMSVNALSLIETGATSPHQRSIERIAAALGVSIEYLYCYCLSDINLPKHLKEVFKVNHISMMEVLSKIKT